MFDLNIKLTCIYILLCTALVLAKKNTQKNEGTSGW